MLYACFYIQRAFERNAAVRGEANVDGFSRRHSGRSSASRCAAFRATGNYDMFFDKAMIIMVKYKPAQLADVRSE